MKKYSNDLRKKAIQMVLKQDIKQVEVAKLLGIDKATVYRWVKRFRDTGDYGLAPQKKAGRKNKISDDDLTKFKKFVQENHHLGLKGMAQKWCGVTFWCIYSNLQKNVRL